jgi:hypothetical protein
MAFATAEDLATYMARDFSAPDTATATQALDIATSIVQSYTGQTLSQVTEAVTVPRTSSLLVLLPQMPVTAVASVVDDGTLLTLNDDYVWHRSGVIHRMTGSFFRTVTVTYTHGYATIPDDVKGATLAVAAGIFTGGGKRAVDDESLGLYTVRYNAEAAALPLEVRAVLDRYKIPPSP